MTHPLKKVALYTRQGCHLCEVAHETLERVRAREPFDLAIIDIDGDPSLVERYGMEVPVVTVDGQKHAKFRVDEAALAKRLQAPT